MHTKHGGSEASGLVLPVGLDLLKAPDGSLLVEPEAVTKARQEAAERRERALQLERRRLALALLPALPSAAADISVSKALAISDELIKQTGGGI